MDKVVSKLNRDLRDGTTKIDLTKGVGNSISKQIDTFKTEYQKFANLTKNNQIDFINAKEAIRSGEQVIKTFSELRRVVGNFEDLTIFEAKKMFPDAFDSKVGELHKKLTSLSNSITELNNKKIELDSAKNAILQLEEKSEKLQSSLEEKTSIKIDTTSAQQELDEANDKIERLRKDLKDQLHLKLTVAEQTKSKGKARIEEIQAARKSRGATKAPESLISLKQRGASADEIIAGRKAIELYKE